MKDPEKKRDRADVLEEVNAGLRKELSDMYTKLTAAQRIVTASDQLRHAWYAGPWTSEACFGAGRHLFNLLDQQLGAIHPGLQKTA